MSNIMDRPTLDTLTERELGYWVAFNRVPKIGPVRFQALLDRYGSLEAAWNATTHDLHALGLPQDAIEQVNHWRPRIDIHREMDAVAQAGARILTWASPAYPDRLREIDASPPVLYVRGELVPDDLMAIGVVGTRGPTSYGKEVARRLCTELAEQGITIVSGLALGIDGIAHRAALDANARTIAVLGCGVDVDYPARHRELSANIARQGAIVSEYGMGIKPIASNFPPRNRIISGLSLGTLVIEAGERSGALITLRFALEQGRETFCVPGSIFSRMSAGTNAAITRGEAKLVSSVDDILCELNLSQVTVQRQMQLALPDDPTERSLLECLTAEQVGEPVHIDEIVRRSGLPVAQVSSTLSMLELKGLVRRVDNMSYVSAH